MVMLGGERGLDEHPYASKRPFSTRSHAGPRANERRVPQTNDHMRIRQLDRARAI